MEINVISYVAELAQTGISPCLPALFSESQRSQERFFEFFTSNIRNPNTREAYYRAALRFSLWCERAALSLASIKPFHVAAYIEQMGKTHSKPSVKQHLAAVRALFDWMVVGQQMELNPAHSVRGPRYSVRKGKTPLITVAEYRIIIESIEPTSAVGLRDRALMATMFNTFGRITAALSMNVEDYFVEGQRSWLRLQEKGGKEHVVLANRSLEMHMGAYITGAALSSSPGGPLFRSSPGRTGVLSPLRLDRGDALTLVQRRAAAAGIKTKVCNHSFRAGGLTNYMLNGGRLEIAQKMAGHESIKTTSIYDRRADVITAEEVERIGL